MFLMLLYVFKSFFIVSSKKHLFYGRAFNLDWYLFQLLDLLKIDSNCFNSFTLSSVDKVITATESFVSVIASSIFQTAEETTHFSDQVKSRIISQLINGISRVLEKLHNYFNGTTISTIFVLPSAGFFSYFFKLRFE